VTLAELRYEMPFLREWVHKAKSGERPGFLAGGAYATDVYYEHAKSQVRRIEQNLTEISRQRETTRARRREGGYSLVSLSGYTNAATTTRKLLGVRGNILMSDTVGFIRDLPPELVKAFNSTLEEIFFADLILLVFDSNDSIDQIKSKIKDSLKILKGRTEGGTIVLVGNKVDLLSDEKADHIRELLADVAAAYELYFVSALTGEGMDALRERISAIQNRSCSVSAALPLTNASYALLSRIRGIADVEEHVSTNALEITILCKIEDADKISGWLRHHGATDIVNKCEPGDTIPKEQDSIGKEGAPLSAKQ
jgi:GTP-binding protein HflX